jgi:DNA repair exonuclease SbcCD nuclease subunit
MRFLQTADWQIGMVASHTGAAAERVRAARFRAGEVAAGLAVEERVDFALVAGDTFEDNAVRLADVERAAAIWDSFGCPVFVIAGNHDPETAGSVWEHGVWGRLRQVRVLREAAPVEIPGGVLYPCPLRQRWGSEDPTAWIHCERGGEAIRIGVAHGSLANAPKASSEFGIAVDAAVRRGLDYLALGHWHSTRIYERMAYCGTHETTSFGEDDSGNVLLVTVEGRGREPVIEKRRCGTLRWFQEQVEIRAAGELTALRERVERLGGAEVLLDLRVRGTLFDGEAEEAARLAAMGARFAYFRLDLGGLGRPLALEELPAGVLRETAQRLQALLPDEAAGLALQDLLRYARGGGK